VSSPFVILFSSYGSPNRGFAGFDEEKYAKTPMVFAPDQQISMRPQESIDGYISVQSGESTELRACGPVGLLLEEDEAIDVLTRYPLVAMHPPPSLSVDLMKKSLISDGHAGFIISLLRILENVLVSVLLSSTV